MHAHRTDLTLTGVAPAGTAAHEHQRRLILELAIEPPADGERLEDLARVLELSRATLEAAADGLVTAGLVERRAGRLFPTAATCAIEALWPLAL